MFKRFIPAIKYLFTGKINSINIDVLERNSQAMYHNTVSTFLMIQADPRFKIDTESELYKSVPMGDRNCKTLSNLWSFLGGHQDFISYVFPNVLKSNLSFENQYKWIPRSKVHEKD